MRAVVCLHRQRVLNDSIPGNRKSAPYSHCLLLLGSMVRPLQASMFSSSLWLLKQIQFLLTIILSYYILLKLVNSDMNFDKPANEINTQNVCVTLFSLFRDI